MQQRQTAVIGVVVILLTALLLINMAFWTGLVPFPFSREFARDVKPQSIELCPVNSEPVEVSGISMRVYNSSNIEGVAGQASQALTDAGVTVNETANWGGDAVSGVAQIYTSLDAVDKAYTIKGFVPKAKVIYDATLPSDSVDLIIGNDWDTTTSLMPSPTAEEFAAAMEAPEGCTPRDDIQQ